MALFGGKKKEAELGMEGPPTEKVITMRQQGMNNHQIVQQLQRDGYTSTQVFDAMNQADLKGGVEMMGDMPGLTTPDLQNPMQFQQPPMAPSLSGFESPQQGSSSQYDMSSESRGATPLEVERIEEIAEAIIDEKWNDLVKSINKIIEWKERIETRISKLEQELTDLKENFNALHQGILGKITEYDKNLTNIGSEIQAMEKVFQKTLPTFTENINELNRLTGDIKKSIVDKASKKGKE